MSRTSELMEVLNRFIRIRNQNRNDYLAEMAKYADEKGSVFYTKKMNEAKTKREQADSVARRECAEKCNHLLQDMRKAADSRKAKPLTVGQQMIIDSLKDKTRLSIAEVEQAAKAMNGNIVGLRQVQEIERIRAKNTNVWEHQVTHNYLRYADPELDMDGVDNYLRSVNDIVKDVLQSGVSRVGQVAIQRAHVYGRSTDPDDYPQKKPFENERDLYGCDFEVFSKAVNGGIEE